MRHIHSHIYKSSIEEVGTPATGFSYYQSLTINPFYFMCFSQGPFFFGSEFWLPASSTTLALLPAVSCYRSLTTSPSRPALFFCYMGFATGRFLSLVSFYRRRRSSSTKVYASDPLPFISLSYAAKRVTYLKVHKSNSRLCCLDFQLRPCRFYPFRPR